MLPVANRLKKKKDFDRIFKKGIGFKEDFLIFKMAKNNLGNSRFGFIVGKTVSKKATSRNRLKRRIRDLVRVRLKEIKEGIDGVFIARPGLENRGFREIETTTNKILKRAKILKE